jgi:hypothetical protein
LLGVPLRSCTVTFTGPRGVSHSIEVVGESLYEAAVLGLNALKNDGWVEAVAPGTTVHVQVREAATTHTLSVAQLRRWCDGIAVSPDEALKKRKLKEFLR